MLKIKNTVEEIKKLKVSEMQTGKFYILVECYNGQWQGAAVIKSNKEILTFQKDTVCINTIEEIGDKFRVRELFEGETVTFYYS